MRDPLVSCSNCAAFEWHPGQPATEKSKMGTCHRGSPTAFAIPGRVAVKGQPDIQVVSAWPPVAYQEWCMMFAPNAATLSILKQRELDSAVVNAAHPFT